MRLIQGLSGGSVVKNPPANAGDMGSILVWEDPLEKGMATHSGILVSLVFLSGKFHGQRSLGP